MESRPHMRGRALAKRQRRWLSSGSKSQQTEGDAQASEAKSTTAPKADAVTTYMERSNSCFEDQIVKPLRVAFADIRTARKYAVTSEDMNTNHGDFVKKLNKIDEEVWQILNCSKQVGRRFSTQVTK